MLLYIFHVLLFFLLNMNNSDETLRTWPALLIILFPVVAVYRHTKCDSRNYLPGVIHAAGMPRNMRGGNCVTHVQEIDFCRFSAVNTLVCKCFCLVISLLKFRSGLQKSEKARTSSNPITSCIDIVIAVGRSKYILVNDFGLYRHFALFTQPKDKSSNIQSGLRLCTIYGLHK